MRHKNTSSHWAKGSNRLADSEPQRSDWCRVKNRRTVSVIQLLTDTPKHLSGTTRKCLSWTVLTASNVTEMRRRSSCTWFLWRFFFLLPSPEQRSFTLCRCWFCGALPVEICPEWGLCSSTPALSGHPAGPSWYLSPWECVVINTDVTFSHSWSPLHHMEQHFLLESLKSSTSDEWRSQMGVAAHHRLLFVYKKNKWSWKAIPMSG